MQACTSPIVMVAYVVQREKTLFMSVFYSSYRSVNGVYMLLISMTDRICVLAKRSGKIGEKAKVILTRGFFKFYFFTAAKI
jgi:hypothetical protein